MRNILNSNDPDDYTHRELKSMWDRMGVIRQYPFRDSKKNIISAMSEFARRNIEFHNITYME